MFSFAVWALYCRLFWGPGWITPAIPVALLFLGLTKLSSRIVRNVPASLKAGILLSTGVAAFLGELKIDGRIPKTPLVIGIILGMLVSEYPLPDIKWGIIIPAFSEM